MRRALACIALFVVMILLAGCASVNTTISNDDAAIMDRALRDSSGQSETQKRLIEGADTLLGVRTIVVRGRKFNNDCTGVVLAIYYHAGIDLSREFSKYTGNGVARIYKHLDERKLLYLTKSPAPGDIIFWDNTYDRNGDGRENDEFTHVGMVVHVSAEGALFYIHLNYAKGIILEEMNLRRPDVHMDGATIVNAPMRMRSAPKSPRWLASHLTRSFGKGYLLPAD